MHLSICLFVGFPAVCVGLSAAPPAARTTGSMSSLSQNIGDSALRQVQWLGQRVAQKEEEYQEELLDYGDGQADHVAKSVYQQAKSESGQQSPAKEKQVWEALAVLEQDSKSGCGKLLGMCLLCHSLTCCASQCKCSTHWQELARNYRRSKPFF